MRAGRGLKLGADGEDGGQACGEEMEADHVGTQTETGVNQNWSREDRKRAWHTEPYGEGTLWREHRIQLLFPEQRSRAWLEKKERLRAWCQQPPQSAPCCCRTECCGSHGTAQVPGPPGAVSRPLPPGVPWAVRADRTPLTCAGLSVRTGCPQSRLCRLPLRWPSSSVFLYSHVCFIVPQRESLQMLEPILSKSTVSYRSESPCQSSRNPPPLLYDPKCGDLCLSPYGTVIFLALDSCQWYHGPWKELCVLGSGCA